MRVLKENHKLTGDKKETKKGIDIISEVIQKYTAQGIHAQQLTLKILYDLIKLCRHTQYYIVNFNLNIKKSVGCTGG